MENPIAAYQNHTACNQNPNPNIGDRDQRLQRLFSAVQSLAASRDSGQRNPVSVEPPASSISWKRPLQTDFSREVSLFNAHLGSEHERSGWTEFPPEYLRPGNLEKYLIKETKKPRLFGDNFWSASGQGDLPPPMSCRQSLLCQQQQPILRTTTAPTRSNSADGLKTNNRRSDHIQYSRDQLLQLREAKSLSEAIILKINQEIEVEFGRINQIIDRGTILVDRTHRSITVNAKEGLKTGDKPQEEVASNSITANANKEETKTGDKAKKRAEKNRKLGVKRLGIQQIQKQKPVSPCRHYLKGRCKLGEACKFSHDVVPLTKSKPCCHFARQGCLKGDDCPFDHQLSKYPCNNYVSTGFCYRRESCLFSHEITKSPSTVDQTGKGTLAIGAVNKLAPQTKAGAPSGTTASVQAYPMEPVKPPKGFTFLNVGNLPPNDSASQKTSNGVEAAGVLLNQSMISNVEKISEAPSVPTSNMTGIFTIGKSSSDIHGENKQLSFPTFRNSSLANVAPFKLSGLTSSSTPFLTRLHNAQGKNTISYGQSQRSLLSTLAFASKCK